MAKRQQACSRKSEGITSGLGVGAYFASLFELNEILPREDKKTDEEILSLCEKEFPNRSIWNGFKGGRWVDGAEYAKYSVSSYRTLYNSGRFTKGVIPEKLSFRYDENGNKITKTGKRLLTLEEEKQLIKEHEAKKAS